jgi:hypothetical protein
MESSKAPPGGPGGALYRIPLCPRSVGGHWRPILDGATDITGMCDTRSRCRLREHRWSRSSHRGHCDDPAVIADMFGQSLALAGQQQSLYWEFCTATSLAEFL